ncbi:tetratricopeptide repeat-containing sulfotransferase family protein [Mesorhizobium huakuii]|uniref:Tetratricopeptide repeat protein n=1 Tax=Mesorhizobium huakuii TaxID=28104 RepID=A0A7G6SZ22_9HYPH|nr:sulfotransferase [Mesorhizobium huakuii]QND59754.1 tetratricopeptide repeat protein [Mesorhizobium huakuii]
MPLLPRRQPLGLPALTPISLPSAGEPAERTLQRGIDQQRRKLFREAEYCYQTVLRSQPKNAMALNLMGTLAIEAGHNATALDYMEKAVKLEPDNAIFRNNLGNAYNLAGNVERARKHLRKAIELDGRLVEAMCNLGRSYRNELEGDIAEGFYRRALAVDGRSLTALVGLGDLLTDMGRQAEAVECFSSALAIDQANVEALAGLALARRAVKDDPALALVRARLELPMTTERERVVLHHAAGKMLNDQREYRLAIRHFADAKAISGNDFDIARHTQLYDSFIDNFDAGFFEARLKFGNPSRRPVFIVGMPRSGTTLTEQICASHRDIHGVGELPYIRALASELGFDRLDPAIFTKAMATLTPAKASQLGSKYLDDLNRRDRKARLVVDKMPHNFELLAFVSLILPNARIIHCRRDPMDNCTSCFMHNFSEAHGYNADLTKLGQYYRQYERLMRHWAKVIPLAIHDMPYEETVADFENRARGLIRFLGVEWDDACLRFHETERTVRTPSRWQVRQPIYSSSVERWKLYGDALDPLKVALGPVLQS